jgi:acyl transferase domain-containing protein/acyl-CoA synthetase (AMP-forming)/AMP-acid ligase II/surfactin synthase thioesterase subunit/acyl carrier protein
MDNATYNLSSMILTRLKKGGDKVAFTFISDNDESTAITYDQLNKLVLQKASILQSEIGSKRIALLSFPTCLEFITSFLACVVSNVIAVPLPLPKSTKDRVSFERVLGVLDVTEAKTLLLRTSDFTLFENIDFNVQLLDLDNTSCCNTSVFVPPNIQENDTAYLQFTSGSSGAPRGVVLSHRNVLANLASIKRAFNHTESTVTLSWLPLHHDMGLVGHVLQPLFEGGSSVLISPSKFLRDPLLWLRSIDKYKANTSGGPAFAYQLCASKLKENTDLDLSSWKNAYVGSDHIPAEVLDSVSECFSQYGFDSESWLPCYGLAEVTLFVGGTNERDVLTLDVDALAKNQVAVLSEQQRGKRIFGYQVNSSDFDVKIVNPATLIECADNAIGEIWLRGPSVGDGYYRNDVASHQTFHRKVRGAENGTESEDYLCTGDLGFFKDNRLYLTGRSKDLIIIRGVNHYPQDIEKTVLMADLGPVHHEVACFSVDLKGHEQLVVIRESRNRGATSDELNKRRELIASKVVDNHAIQVGHVVFVNPGIIARTTSGKISRSQCKKDFLANKYNDVFSEQPNSQKTSDMNKRVPIVGMACRFPGSANSLDEFWALLSEGRDAISEVPADRWDLDQYYSEVAQAGKMNTRWGGFIDDVDQFDPQFFSISPHEAAEMDPQQRILLETSWRAFEHAGITKEQLKGSNTGVFVGISNGDYLRLKCKKDPDFIDFNAYSGLGNAYSIAANRISYVFDLRGPSVAVDTACSSSLTAIHAAVKSILDGECDTAIAGGINLMLAPDATILLSQFGMMADDGRCKTFDHSANGYVRSEGCGMVVLRRSELALENRDSILAWILGSWQGQDGRSNGITSPNPDAQKQLLLNTLKKAQVNPSDVTYIEAHGTGTKVGDPVEMEQLNAVYGLDSQKRCYVGSVKANIGHLEAAAGVAGLIKLILAMQHKKIPRQIHLNELNSDIDLSQSRFYIPTAEADWKESDSARLAAISSFGFGGALVHMLLEEESTSDNTNSHGQESGDYHCILPISADTLDAMDGVISQWKTLLTERRFSSLKQLCQVAATRRSHFRYRAFVVASSQFEFRQSLSNLDIKDTAESRLASMSPEAVFLFSGQSGHFAGMGKYLYRNFSVFKDAFDLCADAFEREQQRSLVELVFRDEQEPSRNGLTELDEYAQPALFAVEYALAQLWISWGIIPKVLLGHSLGEITAACLAGCMTVDETMSLVIVRGKLMMNAPGHGGMLSVLAGHDHLRSIVDLDALELDIAAINGESITIVSGPMASICVLEDMLKKRHINNGRLNVVHAFHSRMMDPILDEFEQAAAKIDYKAPMLPLISSVTGKAMLMAPSASYWRQHLRGCVQFNSAIDQILNDTSSGIFIEIGPGKTLTTCVKHHRNVSKNAVLCQSLNDEALGLSTILQSFGQLYSTGVSFDWNRIYDAPESSPCDLPEHPFNQKRYWFDEVPQQAAATIESSADSALPDIYDVVWQPRPMKEIAKSSAKSDGWIIVGNGRGSARRLQTLLESQNKSVFCIEPGKENGLWRDMLLSLNWGNTSTISMANLCDSEEYAKTLNRIINKLARYNVANWRVVYLGAMDSTINTQTSMNSLEQDHASVGVLGLLALIKGINKVALRTSLWVVTQNAVAVNESTTEKVEYADVSIAQAPIWGLMKTVYLEHPELRGGLVDLEAKSENEQQLAMLIEQMEGGIDEAQVAFRNGIRYVQVLETLPLNNHLPYVADTESAYIITGGLGGIGLACAAWLVEKGAKHIYLLGRRSLLDIEAQITLDSDKSETDSSVSSVLDKVAQLRQAGANVESIACDIRDHQKVSEVINDIRRVRPIKGVLHAAGVNWVAKTVDVVPQKLLDSMAIKVSAAWNLHQLTMKDDIDLFVLFSSVSALWGSVNLAHYTASNYFLDALAQLRHQQGKKAVCIDWGPWSEVGMSAKEEETKLLEMLGLNLMTPDQALGCMERLIVNNQPQAVVASFNWNRFQSFANFSLSPSMFENIAVENALVSSLSSVAHLSNLSQEQAREELIKIIKTHLSSVLHHAPDMQFDDNTRFNFMGMDSLTAMALCARLENHLGIDISAMAVYNYPTIGKLADYLYSLIDRSLIDSHPEAMEGESEQTLSARFFNVPDLSDNGFRLFCFPYAGGGASVFAEWRAMMNTEVDIIPLELPGRENRISEPSMTQMPDIVDAIVEELKPYINKPFGFFGHSLGGLLCFEVARKLQSLGLPLPKPIVISGSVPSQYRKSEDLHRLPDNELLEELSNRFGIVPRDGWNEDLQKALIPTLRADMQLSESVEILDHSPLNQRIHLFAGRDDEWAPPESMQHWKEITTKLPVIELFEGDHMFIRGEAKNDVVQCVKQLIFERQEGVHV